MHRIALLMAFAVASMATPAASQPRAWQPQQSAKVTDCDPSYPTICIPPDAKDIDCDQLPYVGFAVVGEDRHGLDADNDGVGCER
jgi:hypothetical protein